VVAEFAEALEADRPPRTTAAEGLEAVRLADAIKLASAEGRRVDPSAL
jgi:predicted dehydrogenase